MFISTHQILCSLPHPLLRVQSLLAPHVLNVHSLFWKLESRAFQGLCRRDKNLIKIIFFLDYFTEKVLTFILSKQSGVILVQVCSHHDNWGLDGTTILPFFERCIYTHMMDKSFISNFNAFIFKTTFQASE